MGWGAKGRDRTFISFVDLALSSASGQQMFERSSASVDRETPGELRTKRTASAHGLNMSTEGRTEDT